MTAPFLSVILPAYNEGEHIYENIRRVCETLKGLSFERILVDDGSSDATWEEILRAAREICPIQTIRQDRNRGKGAALFRGFEAASGERIAFLDADLEISPAYLLDFLQKMDESGADVVLGTREREENEFPFLRRLMSKTYRRAVSFLFGLSVSDTQTGIKLFKREVLESVAPRMTVSRFAFDIELLVAATRFGYTLREAPVKVAYRRQGNLGRMNLRAIFGAFADTLAIYYRASFWRWLEPGLITRIWMIVFVLGVFLFGVGVGKVLTPVILHPPIKEIFYYLALQFLPTKLRDWLLVFGGMAMVLISLIQLNKSLLEAFARRDRGDLAGIFRK